MNTYVLIHEYRSVHGTSSYVSGLWFHFCPTILPVWLLQPLLSVWIVWDPFVLVCSAAVVVEIPGQDNSSSGIFTYKRICTGISCVVEMSVRCVKASQAIHDNVYRSGSLEFMTSLEQRSFISTAAENISLGLRPKWVLWPVISVKSWFLPHTKRENRKGWKIPAFNDECWKLDFIEWQGPIFF